MSGAVLHTWGSAMTEYGTALAELKRLPR
jgi:hypothetical protein